MCSTKVMVNVYSPQLQTMNKDLRVAGRRRYVAVHLFPSPQIQLDVGVYPTSLDTNFQDNICFRK